jgi:DNA polymerase elongation subunit (family B)
MTTLDKNRIFPYHWYVDEKEKDVTSIRVYGIDEKGLNICMRIDDFTPYVYLELPTNIDWTSKSQLVGNKIDEMMKNQRPLKKVLVMKKKLYGAHVDCTTGQRKLFPYLFCSFSNSNDAKALGYRLKASINVVGCGPIKIKIHESDASPILQLTCCRGISTAGWINFHGKEVIGDDKVTICDLEYKVKWKHLFNHESNVLPRPMIMGFDIEVNSHNPGKFPNAKEPGDKVFQISCVLAREGDHPDEYVPYLLTLGDPDPLIGVEIRTFKTEERLMIGFKDLIRETNPNVIVGYNILGFDIPYLIDRSKEVCGCFTEFSKQGFHKYNTSNEKTIKWSSSAFKNQEFQFLDAEGRLYVDLLPLVRNNYKMNNYKLKTVTEYFIGETKDPLSVAGIFKCYRMGTSKEEDGSYSNKARKAMAICGKYCVQDSVLVIRLMDKLKTWHGLTEMAKTCQVPIFSLYTQGQQIRVYSQVYKFCMSENIVVEKDGYQVGEGERYVGAHVFPPVPGRYEKVVPFDFASLYPTTIIAYNIDYHTHVTDPDIPDHKCNIFEWGDHVGCQHDPKVIRREKLTLYIDAEQAVIKKLRDTRNKTKGVSEKEVLANEIAKRVLALKTHTTERSEINKTKPKIPMCAQRKYRFLKEPKGVIPTVLQNLLDARKHTRKVDMKACYTEIDALKADDEVGNAVKIKELKGVIDVLDKRQLAYKVSCNSMYGAMGVRRGYLPFMPGAMCTTYMGRVNIKKVADVIPSKYGGELIYGDSDCMVAEIPALIRDNRGCIIYRTMDELSSGNWNRINPNKEISSPKPGYEIWSDNGWTPIVNVVRCGIIKPLTKVITHIGVVECSNEHSLLRENLVPVTPANCKLNDKLCTAELPLPSDTPVRPIYNNNLTAQVIRDYEIPTISCRGISAKLAFLWGLFFADGSCGSYDCSNGYKHSMWNINKQDTTLLERVIKILEVEEPEFDWVLMDVMKSSQVYRIRPRIHERKNDGSVGKFTAKWRALFYDSRGNKKVPDEILSMPFAIRQAFFMGHYAGDGSKKDPALTISNKGALGSAGLFFIMRSIGYNVSINTRADKPWIYKLTASTPDKKQRRVPNAIKKLIPTNVDSPAEGPRDYIYDIQTGNHHFSAGVGQLVVHNSNYIHFPHLKTAAETWDHAIHVAAELTKMFPAPIVLEFEEEIYDFFFILTKKRYMYRKCLRDGVVDDKIGKKGVLLARRDNSKFIRDVYEGCINRIADNESKASVLGYVLDEINLMCSKCKPITDFVVTKAVGDNGGMIVQEFVNEKGERKAKLGNYTVPLLSSSSKYPEAYQNELNKKGASNAEEFYMSCLPAQVQLAERMRKRGSRVDSGTRLEYVIADPDHHTSKQYEKVESADYMIKHKDVLGIDYMYYIKALANPLDQVLTVAFKDVTDFVLEQYNFRYKVRGKMLNEFKDVFSPKLGFS